jgi:hypothetical protein
MADWKADLEAFMQETRAFTTSIRVEPPVPLIVVTPTRARPLNRARSEREEIEQRVAKFKAHQQRFIKERQDYAASEVKRMSASRQ